MGAIAQMTKLRTPIRHPDWLDHSNPQTSIDLFRASKLPPTISGWMIVVGLKHPLRAVYGSDLRAAWSLLGQAIADRFHGFWISFKRRTVWKIFGEPEWMKITDDDLYRTLDEEIFGDRKQKGPGSDEGSTQGEADPRA